MIEQIKKEFSYDEWNLITYVLTEGKKDVSWQNLAITYFIKTEKTIEQRGKCANDIWRKFLSLVVKTGVTLETVKTVFNGKGELLFETKKKPIVETQFDVENMEINKVTTNPYGGQWVTYKNKQEENLTDETLKNVVEKLFENYVKKSSNFESYKSNYNKQLETLELFNNNKTLAVVNLYDAHLDKLPVKSTCGIESTFEENIEKFIKAIDKIVIKIKENNVDEIVFPIGNDLFHTNGFNSQTKKGTQIEYFGSPEDNYYVICDVMTATIIKLLAVSKSVKVIMVKGNHDEDKITTLGYWLNRFFKDTNVQVDFLRTQRKYIKFGQNLIGFAHGDKEKSKITQLPLIMATEAKGLWGNTTYRKMYLGDLHHGFEYQFLKAKDQVGVEVEYLRSVGTTDTWHQDYGWVGIAKTAYLQIFDSEKGEQIRYKINIE